MGGAMAKRAVISKREQAQFDREYDVARAGLWLISEQAVRHGVDVGGVQYALFIILARLLAMDGWTAEQLCRDVTLHVEKQTTEGNA